MTTDAAPTARGARSVAYGRIRSEIADGTLAPGSWVREGPLADALGVSRTPIREALNALAAEGLVEIVRHRGARVSSWTRRDVDEVYSLRALLEGEGARLAAERADASVIATLREHDTAFAAAAADLSRLRATGHDGGSALHRAVDANRALHAEVMRAADSPRLESLLASVSSTPLVALAFGHYADADLARSVAGHHDLVLGIEHRDAALAESAMRSHILGARHAATRSATDA